MNQTKTNKQRLAALILVIIGIVIYANALPNKMFWDDDDGITKNAYIQDGRFLPKYFSDNMIAGAGLSSNYWRPVLLISYALEWRMWKNWPPGFHATNIIIHIVNAVLIFYLLWRLFKNWLVSFLPALFFLIHPLQTEAITYVSGRADPSYVLFTLLALIFYLKSKKRKLSAKQSRRYWIFPLVFFVLALMSKEAAIVLPGLIILIDVFLWYKSQSYLKTTKQLSLSFLRKQESKPLSLKLDSFPAFAGTKGHRNDSKTNCAAWKNFVKTETKRVAPFVIIAGAYIFLRATVLSWSDSFSYSNPTAPADKINALTNSYTFFQSLTDYFWLIIWPRALHMERELVGAYSFWQARVIIGFILTITLIVIITLFRRKKPEYMFATGLLIIGLARVVPSLISASTVRGLVYEHWLYLAQIGFWLIVALLINDLIKKYRPAFPSPFKGEGRVRVWSGFVYHGALLLLLFLVFNFSIRTILRNRDWRDPISFYNDILKYNKTSLRVWNNLGMAYAEAGEYQKAIDSYKAAMTLDARTESAPPYHNIANSYRDMGDFDKATANYEKALEIDPEFIFSYRALIALYFNRGEYQKAFKITEKALSVLPESEEFKYYQTILKDKLAQ